MSKPLHHQIVARAREIIADPGRWVQAEYALAKNDAPVDPTDPLAYRFCAVGAIRRVVHEIGRGDNGLASRIQVALEEFIHQHHPGLEDDLEDVNDGHEGHATVLKLFDEYLVFEMPETT
jgi:hypothetical protein